ncbi:MAG: NAD(P)-dependent glycerol-3-phosphate dehydrogenase [Candidatus Omnitrophica bacterium]|nr:NAD(P)-dependent glycerol-3-phosphate dehydrogenase [Candidatus Omnitrophota bacterium]
MKHKKEKIAIIGAGNWGTTLAVILSRAGKEVELYSVFPDHTRAMKKDRENRLFLKGIKFPKPLHINSSLKDVLSNEIIVLAIPVKFIRKVIRQITQQKTDVSRKIFVSVSKGIESSSLKRVSQIIKEELGPVDLAVLSGPNIATEIARGIPSTTLVACPKKSIGKKIQTLFSTPLFRTYLHTDVTGVELAGALKNIIAIACGISDGLGFGTNTKAALVTRGLTEITRLGKKLGAKPQTFWGISGLGDLVTTCFSPFSRNRSVGEQLGRGKKFGTIITQMKMVAEGIETTKSAYQLSKKMRVDMPITQQVYAVLYQNKPPRKAVSDLMLRPLKEEKIG